jgi:hypothetical protein
MSEAELHVLRARLRGGILSKANEASCAVRCRSALRTDRRRRSSSIPTRRCSKSSDSFSRRIAAPDRCSPP